MAIQLPDIIENANTLANTWDEALDRFNDVVGPNGEKFDLDRNIPGISPPTSVRRLGEVVAAAMALVDSLQNVDNLVAVPAAYVAELGSRVAEVKTHVERLRETLDALLTAGPVTAIDSANLVAHNAANQPIKIRNYFQAIESPLQVVLTNAQLIRVMAGMPESREFATDIDRIQRVRADLRVARGEITRLMRLLEGWSARAEELAKHAEESAAAVRETRNVAATAYTEVDTIKINAGTSLSEIKKVEQEATELKSTVDAYRETFEEFQRQLDERNNVFAAGKANLERLTADLHTSEAELERILAKSRAVLGEATVAGLSERFAEEAKEIGRRLRLSQWGLVLSVVFLFMSAITVLVLPLHSAGALLAGIEEHNGWGGIAVFLLSNALSKAILLLPAIFLVVYTARRASDLFHLRAEYTYKYAVAASLPGFKEEAADHAQAITAAAFKELLYNPAASNGINKRRRNTWLERLLEPKIRGAFERMLSETEKAG